MIGTGTPHTKKILCMVQSLSRRTSNLEVRGSNLAEDGLAEWSKAIDLRSIRRKLARVRTPHPSHFCGNYIFIV